MLVRGPAFHANAIAKPQPSFDYLTAHAFILKSASA